MTLDKNPLRDCTKENFCSNFKSLLKKEIEVAKIVWREIELFESDKRNHPPASYNSKGSAFFDSHAAKGMLVEYFEGLSADPPTQQVMTPGQLWHCPKIGLLDKLRRPRLLRSTYLESWVAPRWKAAGSSRVPRRTGYIRGVFWQRHASDTN
jgi:hypothetical protein